MGEDLIQPTLFGGPEATAVKLELSEDVLGLGRAVESVAREIRKGPEGLLDRADRFYELKQTFLPVHSAKRDAKAVAIRAEAFRTAAQVLSEISPESMAATRMLIADYTRRYQNIDATIARAMPMIADGAEPGDINDDWLGFAFDYIGGVSEEVVQELWARLLAQEANRPGQVSKRAVAKLALMDLRSTYQLRNLLSGAITLYVQTPKPSRDDAGMPFYKIGRFVFPLMLELMDWSGPRPGDDLVRGLDRGHDGPTAHSRAKTRWLIDEGFLRLVSHDQMREGYLNASNWAFGWSRGERPLGIRVGLGPIYGCDARVFIEMVRKYASDGATAQILQLTGLAEALLDPRITSMESIREAGDGADFSRYAKKVDQFLLNELQLEPAPPHKCIAENPGYLGREGVKAEYDLEFYYHEY